MSMKVIFETDMSMTSDEALDEYRAGSERFEEGKFGEAFTKFQGSLRAVQQVKVDSEARRRLKIDVTVGTSAAASEPGEGEKEHEESGGDEDSETPTLVPLPKRLGE